MHPVVSIVGKSESGKTTLIEKLIPELKSRGYRVATIKHSPQEPDFDDSGKDSRRHIQAGSEAAAVSWPDKVVMTKPVAREATIDEVASLLGEDYDIVLAEGFKRGNAPKIEVHRKGKGPLIEGLKKVIAVVTDEPLETKRRQFSADDISALVDLLEKGFIRPQSERVVLQVNNVPVILTLFPRQIISNVIMAMVSCLKGVGEIRNVKIFVKKAKI